MEHITNIISAPVPLVISSPFGTRRERIERRSDNSKIH